MYAYALATLHDVSIKQTGISTGEKLFVFIRGFYGLKSLPNFFTPQMSLFLKDLFRQGSALVYIEDILLMSNSKAHMMQLIEQLHDFANRQNLILSPENVSFMLLALEYLGHEIVVKTVKPTQSKIAAIKKVVLRLQRLNWWGSLVQWTCILKLLINLMLIWSLCINYYMIKKNSLGKKLQTLFQQTKISITKAVELTLPNTNHPFFITVSYSLIGLGCVLFQMNDEGKFGNISYNSWIFTTNEQKLCTTYREKIGIVYSLTVYEHNVIGSGHFLF